MVSNYTVRVEQVSLSLSWESASPLLLSSTSSLSVFLILLFDDDDDDDDDDELFLWYG